MRLMTVAIVLSVAGCGNYLNNQPPPLVGDGGIIQDPTCTIAANGQQSPGYPYSLDDYKNNILPYLTATCAASGCHGAPTGQAGFTVWADAAFGNCNYAKTFTQLIKATDLTTPENSLVYFAITGGDPNHPIKIAKTDAKAVALLKFVTDAKAKQAAGGGGTVTPGVGANPFNYNTFKSTIATIFDTAEVKGCAAQACHGGALGVAGFKLVQNATAEADIQANFNAITTRMNLQTPTSSLIYLQATVRHGNGQSALFSADQATQLLNWIKDAQANAGSTGGGVTLGCADPKNFDINVWTRDIQPILFGQINLNNQQQQGLIACGNSACHDNQARVGGALRLGPSLTPEENLKNFACFVNSDNPSQSPALLCPGGGYCAQKSPHPGAQFFQPGNVDLNYQRLLSFLLATKTAATPLDFAFFARQIAPIFNDPTAIQNGAQNNNLTCADTFACHGVSGLGQPAPNGSVFPIIANAGDKQSLLDNFNTAVNFTNFVQPLGSSLFLFPTNEIANLNNPFATGLAHPGGLDFAADSVQAQAILKWSGGLRPDPQGFNFNWLVAGTFPAAQITDTTPIDEVNITPALFDNSFSQQFNGGIWEGEFSANQNIDLNKQFPLANNPGRIGYAVAYVLNTTTVDIQATMEIVSDNAIQVYVGKELRLQSSDARQPQTVIGTFPSTVTSKQTTRLMVKVFQRAADQNFNFQMQFKDRFGNLLTNVTGELVFKLSPGGGI